MRAWRRDVPAKPMLLVLSLALEAALVCPDRDPSQTSRLTILTSSRLTSDHVRIGRCPAVLRHCSGVYHTAAPTALAASSRLASGQRDGQGNGGRARRTCSLTEKTCGPHSVFQSFLPLHCFMTCFEYKFGIVRKGFTATRMLPTYV